MMKLRTILQVAILIVATTMILPQTTFAAETNKNAGTSAFPFLKINVGARAVAMGGAFTGLADDESSLYYNPAGIISFEEDRYVLGYLNYFEDIQSGFVGYIKRFGDRRGPASSCLGLQLDYLSYGDFIETDRFGNTLGEFSGGDLLIAVTYAHRLQEELSLGITGKFIYEKVHDYSSTGLALDLGLKRTFNRGRNSVGLMVQNLGTQLSALGEEKYRLPLTLRAGVSVHPRGLPLVLTSDLIVPVDNDIDFAIGGEYFHFKPLYIRLGWNSFGSNYRAADSEDKWAGLSFGTGFDIKERWHLSYSYSPAADLGGSHRVTISGKAGRW